MNKIIIPLFCLILIASTCEKEDCHYHITYKNESNKEVIFGISVPNSEGKCTIDGKLIEVDSTFKYYPFNGCIDTRLRGNTSPLEVYVVNPEDYKPNGYYDCDSISIKYDILKKYTLTYEYLKQRDFTITYP